MLTKLLPIADALTRAQANCDIMTEDVLLPRAELLKSTDAFCTGLEGARAVIKACGSSGNGDVPTMAAPSGAHMSYEDLKNFARHVQRAPQGAALGTDAQLAVMRGAAAGAGCDGATMAACAHDAITPGLSAFSSGIAASSCVATGARAVSCGAPVVRARACGSFVTRRPCWIRVHSVIGCLFFVKWWCRSPHKV
jgi:hypothetical protein